MSFEERNENTSETNVEVEDTTTNIQKEWTVMIYMAGDNNLSADMSYAIEDIRNAISDKEEKINLLVYYDSAAQSAPTLYCDFTNFDSPFVTSASSIPNRSFGKPKSRVKDKDEDDTVENRRRENRSIDGEENSASDNALLNFIDWSVNEVEYKVGDETRTGRKAQKYALILSGHSSAFQNFSFMIDESSDYFMTMPRLRHLLQDITGIEQRSDRLVKQLLNQKLDILGFDSCSMGMLELGYQFSKYAKTMVASEGNLPSAGWTYGSMIAGLIHKGKSTHCNEIVKGFVRNFINKQSNYNISGVSIDVSAWDLNIVSDVVTAVNILAGKLIDVLKDDAYSPHLKGALLQSHLECQSYMIEQNVDLKDFCQLLINEVLSFDADDKIGIVDLSKKVIEAVDKCILLCGVSGGAYQYSNGISIFFPWTAQAFQKSKNNYTDLVVFGNRFWGEHKLDNWNNFLEYYLTEVTLRKAREIFSNNSTEGNSDTNPINGTVRDNRLIAGDRDNRVIIGDRDNRLITGDRDNRVIVGDRDNRLIVGDRGIAASLIQFKNIQKPWFISGFTKPETYKINDTDE